ncbi:MAG: hypothetical protein Tsb0034_00120 [Ekhidna sp.]
MKEIDWFGSVTSSPNGSSVKYFRKNKDSVVDVVLYFTLIVAELFSAHPNRIAKSKRKAKYLPLMNKIEVFVTKNSA